MSSMICFLTAITDVMVCAIMSMGIQMMTSLLPPNAAQLLIGTSTRPGECVLIAACTASLISAEPAG